MKRTLSFISTVTLATLLLAACQTAPLPTVQPTPTNKPTHPQHPQQPQTKPPTTPKPFPSSNTGPTPTAGHVSFPDTIATTFADIENAFAADDCVRVLENWNKLNLPTTDARFSELPKLAAVAVALCDTKTSPQNPDKAHFAVRVLSKIEQTSTPLLEKSWLAKNIASQHIALGEFDEATSASQREKDYLLQYNARLMALNGSITPITPAPTPLPNPTPSDAPMGVEKAITDARLAINSGDPATAVTILDTIPELEKNDRSKRLRKEAAEAHVKDLRTRARQQYQRAQSQQNKQGKIDALQQSREINEFILSKYPETPSRPGIERSLSSIKSEIEFLNRGR